MMLAKAGNIFKNIWPILYPPPYDRWTILPMIFFTQYNRITLMDSGKQFI